MLLGRAIETARIDDVLGEARHGRSSVLVVRGEAGVGKTALLRYAYHQAEDALRLTARGIESESAIAYSGLLDLLRPIASLTESLPAPQAAALAGALAMGPPVAGDRFTTYAAVLGLLASAAENSPVVAIVDDVQWLDPPSSEALLFAARRLEAEEIAIILSVREGEGTWTPRDSKSWSSEGWIRIPPSSWWTSTPTRSSLRRSRGCWSGKRGVTPSR